MSKIFGETWKSMDFFLRLDGEIRTSLSGVFASIYFPKSRKSTSLVKSDFL